MTGRDVRHALLDARIWVGVIAGVLLSLGFRWTSPSARLDAVEVKVARLEAHQVETTRVIRAVAKMTCLQSTPEYRSLLDLPCDDLLHNRVSR